MKVTRIFVPAFAVLCCSLATSPGQEKKVSNAEIEIPSIYPCKPGAKWVYRVLKSTGGPLREERGKVIITAEKFEELPYKILDQNGKEVILVEENKEVWARCTRLKISDDRGEKTQYEDVAVLWNGVYRFRTADKDMVPPLRFFSFEIEKNKSWKVSSRSDDKKEDVTFNSEGAEVVVPAGKFDSTYHIFAKDFTVGDQKMELDYWFAKDRGMVKQRTKLGDTEIILELEKGPSP